jgi:hypothetical protein
MMPTRQQEREDTMHARENRWVPIIALIAMLIVSVTIVALTCWSGDLFGPSVSAPSDVVEQRSVEARPSSAEPGGAVEPTEAFRGSRGKNDVHAGMQTARTAPGASARHTVKDSE